MKGDKKMQKIWFDMDGTIANLYGVENWLPKLRAHDASPYMEAAPMVRLSALARVLNKLTRIGYEIGIVSWLSKDPDPAYGEAVTAAKLAWLAKHMPSVKWNAVLIVPYGTPKSEVANLDPHDILFDDEENNIIEWEEAGGWGFAPSEMMDFLRSI